jgi:N-acetylmuramoyl-L-alanine amidase
LAIFISIVTELLTSGRQQRSMRIQHFAYKYDIEESHAVTHLKWRGRAKGGVARSLIWMILSLIAIGSALPATGATVARAEIAVDCLIVCLNGRVAAASGHVQAMRERISLDVIGLEPGAELMGLRTRLIDAGTTRRALLLSPAELVDARFDANGRSLALRLRNAGPTYSSAAVQTIPIDFQALRLGEHKGPASSPRLIQPGPPRATAQRLPIVRGGADLPLVVIDAGHGGFDPGAIGPDTGLREKDVTLKIVKAIRDELQASGRVRVALTRGDDRYLTLRERFGIARRLHADLFISIHCDSVGTGDASGASVYTLSEVASDKEAARLATRENKADVIAGVDLVSQNADVSSLLIALTQRETMNSSAGFARLLGREAAPLMSLKPNFHRMASLMVLKAPDVPSILFETGYISNSRDAEFLDSVEGRERIAKSVTRAVEVHFAKRVTLQ